MDKSLLKAALRSVGLYEPVRRWYRRLNAEAREARDEILSFYKQFVNPGDLCFDIGANVGQTIEAILACGGNVVSVEPNPLCMKTLRREFGLDPRVRLVEKAIGSKVGHADLHYSGTAATGSLRPDWPFGAASIQQVEVTTLDELIAQYGQPAFCKIDVEGFELEVLAGLSRPIHLICFEYHRLELPRAFSCLDRLESIGHVEAARLGGVGYPEIIESEWLPLSDLAQLLTKTDAWMGDIIVRMTVNEFSRA
jgi:FkbM family methyltransferase